LRLNATKADDEDGGVAETKSASSSEWEGGSRSVSEPERLEKLERLELWRRRGRGWGCRIECREVDEFAVEEFEEFEEVMPGAWVDDREDEDADGVADGGGERAEERLIIEGEGEGVPREDIRSRIYVIERATGKKGVSNGTDVCVACRVYPSACHGNT
jgi:hypothetical protein